VLKRYPEIVKAMFETVGDPTPKELQSNQILELREEVKEPRKTIKVQISS